MAYHEILVKKLVVEPHNNADRLEIVKIDGYTCVTQKGLYKTGDLAAYIPEQSLVPENLLEFLGIHHARIRPAKLRGVFSMGMLFPLNGPGLEEGNWKEGDDVGHTLGITKWEPPVPKTFSGKAIQMKGVEGINGIVQYSIDNWQKHPDVFEDGDNVMFTEKIHGTLCRISYINSKYYISSKGLGNSGFAFEDNVENVYLKAFNQYKDNFDKLTQILGDNFTVFAEIFGKEIQDMEYGGGFQFQIFDIHDGNNFIDAVKTVEIAKQINILHVPVLYKGGFSDELVTTYTKGNSVIKGASHMREGIVIKPLVEKSQRGIGRVILKSKSQAYLMRNKGTEYE